MGLESGTTIGDLNDLWPLGTDQKAQGDDHIRLIKKVIKNTFVGLDDKTLAVILEDYLNRLNGGTLEAPVTMLESALNLRLDSATVPFLDAEAVPKSYVDQLVGIEEAVWEPYGGEGTDPLFWDFAVDGNLPSIDTPNFEAGYEYRYLVENFSAAGAKDYDYEIYGPGAVLIDTLEIAKSVGAYDFLFRSFIQANQSDWWGSESAPQGQSGSVSQGLAPIEFIRVTGNNFDEVTGKNYLFRRIGYEGL